MSLPLHIVLVHPEIPQNTGAIGRLCVGLDAPLHLIRPLGFAMTSAWLKRAGLDYWAHLDLRLHDTWDAFLAATNPARFHLASTRGRHTLYACRFNPGDAIIFGNESRGLPPPFYQQYADALFCIPMPGVHARSLNLANAVAVVAYEAWRQLQPAIDTSHPAATPTPP
jgi:tRNA (cytidine/uridine-2'-O-)-methyltransferase